MAPSESRHVVEAFLSAMQRGPDAEDTLIDLFTEDAVYIQALNSRGRPRRYVGKAAIRRALHAALQWNPPDFLIRLDRLEVEADHLVAHWTCTSEKLPHPMQGVDRYTLRGRRIERLETRLIANQAGSS
jgi:SnoaL-like domain